MVIGRSHLYDRDIRSSSGQREEHIVAIGQTPLSVGSLYSPAGGVVSSTHTTLVKGSGGAEDTFASYGLMGEGEEGQ